MFWSGLDFVGDVLVYVGDVLGLGVIKWPCVFCCFGQSMCGFWGEVGAVES